MPKNPYAETPAGTLRKLNDEWKKHHTWVSPTSFTDVGSWWNNEPLAYDGDTQTYSQSISTMTTCNYADYLVLILASPIKCNKVRIWLHGSRVDDIEIDVYKDGTWVSVLDGGTLTPQYAWREYGFVEGSVEKARIRYHTGGSPPAYIDYLCIHEFEFWEVPPAWGGSAFPQLQMAKAILGL